MEPLTFEQLKEILALCFSFIVAIIVILAIFTDVLDRGK